MQVGVTTKVLVVKKIFDSRGSATMRKRGAIYKENVANHCLEVLIEAYVMVSYGFIHNPFMLNPPSVSS